MNLIFAPFIVLYLLLLYFFRYFEVCFYHKSCAHNRNITRTPGLWDQGNIHLLPNGSFESSTNYIIFSKSGLISVTNLHQNILINSLKKRLRNYLGKSSLIFSYCSFVAFISGSFAAVLFLVSLIDPELFLGFEITKDRTVLFYLGLFGTILAVSRGMIPEENLVFEPEAMLTQVIEYTHYCPSHWNGKLHSYEVAS